MKKSQLHRAAVPDGEVWHSLPPHVPGACYGSYGAPCPTEPAEPCGHNHRTARLALACSATRTPFNLDSSQAKGIR